VSTGDAEFLGYVRPDGSVGVRNHLLILSLTGLTGPAARRIARSLPGCRCVTMPYASGLLGEDAAVHDRALLGLARHPNVGAVVLVGGNKPELAGFAEALARSEKPCASLALDDCGHDALTLSDRGIRAGAALAREISRQRRQPAPSAALFLAFECGRSDPSSGLVSNPLVGRIADRMVDSGGRAAIGETLEWLGAEHLLAARATTPAVGQAIVDAVRRREAMAVAAGLDLLGHNPGPTNIDAGLSSIEEKSLGNVAKSGARPIRGVIGYAQAPPGPGLWVMDAPAYAPESLTGFTAAGAQLLLFTTGVGNSFVSELCPTIKLSANPVASARLGQQLDFDASAVFAGREALERAAERLFEVILDVASGTLTWGEVLGEGEEVVSRFGPAL
jgi:altronate dehydratase large subunit